MPNVFYVKIGEVFRPAIVVVKGDHQSEIIVFLSVGDVLMSGLDGVASYAPRLLIDNAYLPEEEKPESEPKSSAKK